jgi:hypothetical protein
MLLLKYNMEDMPECDQKVKDCCVKDKKPPDTNTGSGDCCYDGWTIEFKDYDKKYKHADSTVTYITERLKHLGTQRDMWKAWKDELDKICEFSKTICHQLEIVLHHTTRISRNEWLTKRAINLLFCMIRDFYMQIDLLKKKYDYLINCIRCINNPGLVSGQGVMGLIEDYGKKLTIVIQTRDALIDAVVTAISIVNNINKNLGHQGHQFGLTTVLHEWKQAFNCEGKPEEESDDKKGYDYGKEGFHKPATQGEFEDTGLEPMLRFPVCESRYYKKIDGKYVEDTKDFNKLTKWLLDETKHRDNLKALRDGLTSVISDPNVDPSKRCATNGAK